LKNSILSAGEEAHHKFRGLKSACIAGILCALFLMILSLIDYYFKHSDYIANEAKMQVPSKPWFFIALSLIHLGIFSVSMMRNRRKGMY